MGPGCLLVGLLVIGGASASDDASDLLLFDELPSVFGASRYEQTVTDAPASVTVLTSEDIARHGWQTLAEAMDAVRGVFTTWDGSYAYIAVHGLQPPGDYNTRVLLLVDGVRINDDIYQQGLADTSLPVDLEMVERIEVIRGPGSSVYGPSALLGVINVITRRGRDLDGVGVGARVESFGGFGGRLAWGRRAPSGVEALISGSYRSATGREVTLEGYPGGDVVVPDQDHERVLRLAARVSWRDLSVDGWVGYRRKEFPTGAWWTVPTADENWTEDLRGALGVRYRTELARHTELNVGGAMQVYRYRGSYVYDWAEEEDPPDLVANRDLSMGLWWSADATVSTRLWERVRLLGGLETQVDLIARQVNWDEPEGCDGPQEGCVNLDHLGHAAWGGVFVQADVDLVPGVTLDLGGRLDLALLSAPSFSPRGGLLVDLPSRTTLKLLVSSAYRRPSLFERYYADPTVARSNPDLRPEHIRSGEVVVEQQLGRDTMATVSVWRNDVRGLLRQISDEEGWLTFENVDDVNGAGLEAEVRYLGERVDLRASGAVMAVRGLDGQRVANAPWGLVRVDATPVIWPDHLMLTASGRYLGERRDVFGGSIPSSMQVDLALLVRNLVPGMELQLVVRNVADKVVRHPLSEEYPVSSLQMEGRTFRLNVQYVFR